MKRVQKMMLVPEHLLQSLETEHRLTSPPQLTTLTHLDQDMKHITSFPHKTTFFLLYSSFFTLRSPLCKFSLKKNKAFVDLSRRVKPFVYVL